MVLIGMCGQHACKTAFMPRQCMPQQASMSGGFRTAHMASPLRHCRRQQTSRSSLAVQAESTPVELVLKGDEGAPPLKQVFKQASKPSRNMHTVLPSMTGMPMSGCRVDDGRQLHSVPLQRPLGATLAEKDGKILIEKIRDGSNAALAGLQLNDVVRATTARAKDAPPAATTETSRARAKQDFFGRLVLIDAEKESFDTFLAALESSKCASCDVTLVVDRPKGQHKESPQSHMDRPELKEDEGSFTA